MLGADGSTVIAQNDNARTGQHGSYMEYTATATVQDATVKVLPMQRSMRGSYQLYVSTTQPDLSAAPPSPPGGAGAAAYISNSKQTIDNAAYDIMTLNFAGSEFLDAPKLRDGDHTSVGGECAGVCDACTGVANRNGDNRCPSAQHDEVVAVQLSRTCSTSKYAVMGRDASVPDTGVTSLQ